MSATRRALTRTGAATVAAALGLGLTGTHAWADDDRTIILGDGTSHAIREITFNNIVPGDNGEFNLTVRNGGPENGVLTAAITGVELSGDNNRSFYKELMISGEHLNATSVRDLYGHDTPLLEAPLAKGQSVAINLAYDFPFAATGGNAAKDGDHVASIDVAVRITGEAIPDPPPVSPSPTPPVTPSPSPSASPSASASRSPSVTPTASPDPSVVAGVTQKPSGGAVVSVGPLAMTGANVTTVGLGALALIFAGIAALRRRKEADQ